MPNKSGRRQRRSAPPRSNRERILDVGLKLFNERGAPAVSTNTIAGELGISPGNVYYHFANKEQIIRELWSQFLETEASPLLTNVPAGDVSPEDLAAFFVASVDMMWKYRFVPRDIDELIARDPDFADAFRAVVAGARDGLFEIFRSLVDHGVMDGPADRVELTRVGTNIQILFLNWIRFVTTVRGHEAAAASTEMRAGALQAFVMLEPYLEDAYALHVRELLEPDLSGHPQRTAY